MRWPGGRGLSRLRPDNTPGIATWLDAREPARRGDLGPEEVGRGVVSDAAPVLLVGVPRDLEEMTIGIGEVPGVDAERAHVSGRGRRASGSFDVPEQLIDLCL
jgi:hypothetical protein